ncbi:MAG: isoprenylcysteine carboxylmethyltransferase family protein [Pseudomonadota bacterium]
MHSPRYALALKVPPPIYLLSFGALMWVLCHSAPLYQWAIPTRNLGFLIVAVGFLLDVTAVVVFFRERTTVSPLQPEKTAVLITNGPYRFSRNPMYAGMFIMLTGWSLSLQCVSSVIALPLFVLLINKMQIEPEERVLNDKFGETYERYCQQVRRWV